MIINICGTSGSGKSTIVRSVMEHYAAKTPHYIDGRKQPIGYELSSRWRYLGYHPDQPAHSILRPLWVVGHYESPCGGCDTISIGMDFIYNQIRDRHQQGFDVLYEGVIIGYDVKRCLELWRSLDSQSLCVIGLTTPIEDCLQGIRNRREARGDTRPLNPENTINRVKPIQSRVKRLKDAGVNTAWLSREDALKECLRLLGWSA